MLNINTVKQQSSQITQTITEPGSSSPFLEKEKEMLELKVKLLSKKPINMTTQAKKPIPFDISDPFIQVIIERDNKYTENYMKFHGPLIMVGNLFLQD